MFCYVTYMAFNYQVKQQQVRLEQHWQKHFVLSRTKLSLGVHY